ncbi:MAG: nucleotidyltransferase domain-containing protein [Rubrivivax sp.]|nr:nucleotidyltransferase domain-containing protein [Rubrivivax sp.]
MNDGLAPGLRSQHGAVAALCETYGVSRLEVFGSAADGGFDPARSDFDFIARFEPDASQSLARRYVAFCEALEQLLGRRVDVMTDRPIENPYFRRAVDASRRDFYVRPAAQAPA